MKSFSKKVRFLFTGVLLMGLSACGWGDNLGRNVEEDETNKIPAGLVPTLVSTTSMDAGRSATDGDWLVWIGKDRQGISLLEGSDIQDLTAELAPEHYPESMNFDGRYVVFISGQKHLFVVDTRDASPVPELLSSSDDRIEYFDISEGELVWIDETDDHVYYLDLNSASSTPVRITDEDRSRIMVKIDDGVIVWSESISRWRVLYYDLRADNPAPVQPSGQTSLDHWMPDIHNRLIVWQGSDAGNDVEIFYYDMSRNDQAARKLTDNLTDDRHPRVDNGIIAWDGRLNGEETISYMDMNADSPTLLQLPTALSYDRLSHIRDGVITWTASAGGIYQILCYDLNADTPGVVQVTNTGFANYEPVVDDGTILWRSEETSTARIMAYDVESASISELGELSNTKVTGLFSEGGGQVWLSEGANFSVYAQPVEEDINPVIISSPDRSVDSGTLAMDGGIAVWRAHDGSNMELYYCDLNSENQDEVIVSDDNRHKESPDISDGILTWRGQADGGGDQVYYADLPLGNPVAVPVAVSGQENLSPNIHDGLMTWLGGVYPNYEVYYYDLNAPTPQATNLTGNSLWEANPVANEGVIAWYRQHTGNINDIWYNDLSAATPLEVQVTNTGDSDDRVQAFRDRIIVWTSTFQADWSQDVFFYNLSAASPQVVRVTNDGDSKGGMDTDGGKIVWSAEGEIWFYDAREGSPSVTRITDNDLYDSNPKIRSDVVIWKAGDAVYAARW